MSECGASDLTDLPNMIFIILDTMRKDVLSAYGGAARTPAVDLLANDSVVYPACIAPSPWTVPSHASLFTGKYPSQHGIHETRERKIPELFGMMAGVREETLAEYLRERGYNTIGYSANPSVAPGSGFDAAFNSFSLFDVTRPTDREKRSMERVREYGKTRSEVATYLLSRGRARELISLYRLNREMERRNRLRNYPIVKGGDRIAESLAESSFEEPFFIFVNLFEMHEPYTNTEPTAIMDLFEKKTITPTLLREIKQRYYDEARMVDTFLGGILEYFRQSGKYEDTLIVLTSDHGQALKEHGFYGHGTFLHREIVEVPLIVKYPTDQKGKPPPGYQSLTRIPEMVKDCLVGIRDGSALTRDVAFSESFGIPHGLESVDDVPRFEERRTTLDRPRKAVYKDGYRLVVADNGIIESFELRGRPIEQNGINKPKIDELLGELASLDGKVLGAS